MRRLFFATIFLYALAAHAQVSDAILKEAATLKKFTIDNPDNSERILEQSRQHYERFKTENKLSDSQIETYRLAHGPKLLDEIREEERLEEIREAAKEKKREKAEKIQREAEMAQEFRTIIAVTCIGFIIFFLLPAIITWRACSAKGFNPIYGCLLVFLGTWLGCLVVLFVLSGRPEIPKIAAGPALMNCPVCRKKISISATFCSHCNAIITAVDRAKVRRS